MSSDRESTEDFTLKRRHPSAPNMSVDGVFVCTDFGERPSVPEQFLVPKPPAPHVPGVPMPDEAPTEKSQLSPERMAGLRQVEINESLNALETPQKETAAKPGSVKQKKRFHMPRIPVKRVLLAMLAVIILGAGYFGVKFILTSSKMFSGNVFDLLGSGATLKKDANGRTNILIFGTSEDDPSHQEAGAGANLTDSIMVVSFDQTKKDIAMFSVPRDLWVKYGKACNSGYQGKINEVYICNGGESDEKKGANGLMDMISTVTGLDIQYYTHVNYTVLRDVVDAVNGVDVTIESEDPRGVLDRNFDWICRYQCYKVKYPNGTTHLDGEHALYLARARGDLGAYSSYGFNRGNFDRELYQQKILVALKDKATSAGVIANPLAVTKILDGLGSNVRTNFSTSEVKTLMGVAAGIDNSKIKRISLVDEKKPVVETGSVGDASVVRPIDGLYDYSGIKAYLKQQILPASQTATTTDVSSEDAYIEVYNGSDNAGVAGKMANKLIAAGLPDGNVTTGDVPTRTAYGDFVWYDLSGGKTPQTKAKIQFVLGRAPTGTTLPTGVRSDADFVIIVGNGTY